MHKHRILNILIVTVVLLGLFTSACAPTPAPEAPAAEAPEDRTPALKPPRQKNPAAEAPKSDVELVFVWHSGGLGEKFEELCQEYTALTGVKVRADLVPYGPQWHDKIAAEFAARGSGFDLAMFDSQSMSEFASGGHVVQLNDYIANSDLISLEDFSPAAITQYGEYPEGSGNIYALANQPRCDGSGLSKGLIRRSSRNGSLQS